MNRLHGSVLAFVLFASSALAQDLGSLPQLDGTTFRVKVTPYSRSGSHIDETLWIFSDEGAALTPPPDENE